MVFEQIEPATVDLQHRDAFVPGLLGDLHQRRIGLDRGGDEARAQAVAGEGLRIEARTLRQLS